MRSSSSGRTQKSSQCWATGGYYLQPGPQKSGFLNQKPVGVLFAQETRFREEECSESE